MAERGAGKVREAVWSVARPALAALVGLALGVGVTAFAGENPWDVFLVIVRGAFGGPYDFGMTLFHSTPLILTGLAVALPFRAGLFNIGAEGQLTLGALAAAVVGITMGWLPWPVAIPLAALAAALAGGVWGLIPGWIRARRGGHEVISTIMLNFVAAGLANWVTLYLVRSTDTQNPESARVGAGFLLEHFAVFAGAPVTGALVMALVAAVVTWAFLAKTVPGFELRVTGANAEAASTGGVAVPSVQMRAMAWGGALAGLVGVAEVLGNAGRFRLGFSPDYGFIGIPVALLARCHPVGVVFSALLFGALHKGTGDLDLETMYVTRDLSSIIQALVVLCVSVEGFWARSRRLRGGRADA
jgi:simple sugar transport system permease protein